MLAPGTLLHAGAIIARPGTGRADGDVLARGTGSRAHQLFCRCLYRVS